MTSRLKKASYTTIIGLGLFAGAAGIAAAGNSNPAHPSVVVTQTPAAETPAAKEIPDASEAAGDTGVNCENGIDTATGLECDGGPSAAQANEATEAPDAAEANDATEANDAAGGDEADGVNCEDGIVKATGAECDGGPAANQANDPNEPAGVEDANG
jgi:hypothetical protein